MDAWSVASGQLVVDLPGARLGENIQRTGPSIPSYVVALCYWYEVATGERLNGVVRVVGSVPDTVSPSCRSTTCCLAPHPHPL